MKKKTIVIILLLLLLAGFSIYFMLYPGNSDSSNLLSFIIPDKNAEEWNGDQELPQTGGSEEVAIPGFKSLVCYAGQTVQKVNLYNPEENSVLLKMTMYANSEKLWESGYIEPGKGFYQIEFCEPLKTGTYDGELLVECFLQDGTEMNKAKVKFDLYVEEKQN